MASLADELGDAVDRDDGMAASLEGVDTLEVNQLIATPQDAFAVELLLAGDAAS